MKLFQFAHEEFGNLRVVLINNMPWFVGCDVANALGYADPQKAIHNHVDDEDKMVNSSFTSQVLINEAGLYSLIFSNQTPRSKRFSCWVTHDVISAIFRNDEHAVAQIVEQTFNSVFFN